MMMLLQVIHLTLPSVLANPMPARLRKAPLQVFRLWMTRSGSGNWKTCGGALRSFAGCCNANAAQAAVLAAGHVPAAVCIFQSSMLKHRLQALLAKLCSCAVLQQEEVRGWQHNLLHCFNNSYTAGSAVWQCLCADLAMCIC